MMTLFCPGGTQYHRPVQLLSYKLILLLSVALAVWFLIRLNQDQRHRIDSTANGPIPDPFGYGEPATRFIVDTPGCTIPDIDPFDPSLRKIVFPGKPLICTTKPSLTYTIEGSLYINKTALRLHYDDVLDRCQYEGIVRPAEAKSDNVYKYLPPVEFKDDVLNVSSEFLRVACFGKRGHMLYANFHAMVAPKQRTELLRNEQFEAFRARADVQDPFDFLIVGVDSVSRLNFVRQMPRTRRFLIERLEAVELKGYNKVADNTFVNLAPMFAGQYADELPWDAANPDATFDDCPFIWKRAATHGYRTLFAEDAPTIAIFNYEKAGFQRPPTDYYLRPFSLAVEDHGSVWNAKHNCIGPKPETEVVLDYVSDFVRLFAGKPRFAFAFLTRLTHDGINKAGAADPLYLDFFRKLDDAGHLENAVVLFYSDHGMRFGAIRETYIGQLEERLPFTMIGLPVAFRRKYPEYMSALRRNERRLTTPFDIYTTLSSLLEFTGDELPPNELTQRGMNLLVDIPIERTCLTATIHSHWCTCHRQEAVDVNSDVIRLAALRNRRSHQRLD
ncbi:hypothetical protein LSH36_2g08008 [Paralvinella palmiformis]|uniref:Uncharacterized protein n=1 Tax=Paralvinella palmiformis TaxID=53620 RepID=A0AAD9KFW4_9ANNE|nr:hypothetical protein LSH36_2g08008 [Paralvinella palmiformis]